MGSFLILFILFFLAETFCLQFVHLCHWVMILLKYVVFIYCYCSGDSCGVVVSHVVFLERVDGNKKKTVIFRGHLVDSIVGLIRYCSF